MNTPDLSVLAKRVAQVRARILSAGGKDVMLIAVTKSFDVNALIGAHATGCDAVGENYAQELITKLGELPNNNRLPVHHHVSTTAILESGRRARRNRGLARRSHGGDGPGRQVRPAAAQCQRAGPEPAAQRQT